MSGGRRGALVAVLVIAFGIGGGCSSKTGPAGGDAGAAAPTVSLAIPAGCPPITEGKVFHYIVPDSYVPLVEQGNYAEIERQVNEWLATRLDRDSRYNLNVLPCRLAHLPGMDEHLAKWQEEFPQSHYPHLIRGLRRYFAGWGNDVGEERRESGGTAREELELAQEMRPEDPNSAAFLIGVELTDGQSQDAMEEHFAAALAADPFNTQAYFQKVNFLFPMWHGSWPEARAVAMEATAKATLNPHLYLVLPLYHRWQYNMAEQKGGYYRDSAVRTELNDHYGTALAQFPEEYLLHAFYARDAWSIRDFELSLREYARAVELMDSGAAIDLPNNQDFNLSFAETYNFYAWILATSPNDNYRDGARALACAKKAVALRPNWTQALDTLAEAYAETGDFQNAIKYTREGIKYSDAPGMTRHMEKNLLLFAQEQPFRSRYQ